jgi:hypothetical protein
MSKMEKNDAGQREKDKLNLYIHIIESPSSEDIMDERREGELLTKGLKLLGIPHKYYLVIDQKTFLKALTEKIEHDNKELGIPILHLSSHGDNLGIKLSDQSFIRWHELAPHLTSLNDRIKGNLMICISTCNGFQAAKMAHRFSDESPFFGIIGPSEKITWAEAAIGFLTFYFQLLVKHKTINEALDAMKTASGYPYFEKIKADEARTQWLGEIVMSVLESLNISSQKINDKEKPLISND